MKKTKAGTVLVELSRSDAIAVGRFILDITIDESMEVSVGAKRYLDALKLVAGQLLKSGRRKSKSKVIRPRLSEDAGLYLIHGLITARVLAKRNLVSISTEQLEATERVCKTVAHALTGDERIGGRYSYLDTLRIIEGDTNKVYDERFKRRLKRRVTKIDEEIQKDSKNLDELHANPRALFSVFKLKNSQE